MTEQNTEAIYRVLVSLPEPWCLLTSTPPSDEVFRDVPLQQLQINVLSLVHLYLVSPSYSQSFSRLTCLSFLAVLPRSLFWVDHIHFPSSVPRAFLCLFFQLLILSGLSSYSLSSSNTALLLFFWIDPSSPLLCYPRWFTEQPCLPAHWSQLQNSLHQPPPVAILRVRLWEKRNCSFLPARFPQFSSLSQQLHCDNHLRVTFRPPPSSEGWLCLDKDASP